MRTTGMISYCKQNIRTDLILLFGGKTRWDKIICTDYGTNLKFHPVAITA